MKNHNKSVVAIILVVLLAGCASAPPEVKEAPVFYPEPPALARIQFLTSFTSSLDIAQKKSAFDKFLKDDKEIISRLDKPYGIATDENKIYVCDTNSTVAVFDLDKKTFGPLQGAQGRGKLLQPINISIDKDGNRYVSDPMRQSVVMFDKGDFFVKAFGIAGDWKPVDAVAYEGRLYVADAKNGEIKVFDVNTGEMTQKFGRQEEDLKERLGIPTNLAFDSEGYLYVSDTGRIQIVKMDRDGHIRGTIGQLGSQVGSFARPRGIAFDREGRLYAIDAAFDNIQMFTKEGQLLFFFGKSGQQPGDLYLPAKVAIDYKNIAFFKRYADPGFEIEALILVTSQFGNHMVNIYGLGKEKGKKYPTEEELKKIAEEKIKQRQKEKPDEGEKKE
jgi:hypothetical protein